VEITGKDDRTNGGSDAENDGFGRVGILSHDAKRRLKVVVLLVDVLVEGSPVEEIMAPELPGVLNN